MRFWPKRKPSLMVLRRDAEYGSGLHLFVEGEWRASAPEGGDAPAFMLREITEALHEIVTREKARRIEAAERAELAKLKAKYEVQPTPEERKET